MKTKKSHLSDKKLKWQDFIMAAILTNCRGYQIEDKVDGTVRRSQKWAELFFSHL